MMKLIFCMQVDIEVSCNLIISFWVGVARLAQSIQNQEFTLQYSQKNIGNEVDFLPDVFCKLIVILSVCIARHTQSTRNNKFAISLQYLKENVKDEDFCLQINVKGFFRLMLSFQVHVAWHTEITQITSLLFLCNIVRKK